MPGRDSNPGSGESQWQRHRVYTAIRAGPQEEQKLQLSVTNLLRDILWLSWKVSVTLSEGIYYGEKYQSQSKEFAL